MKQLQTPVIRKQTGITLIETAIALAIAALVVGSAFIGFQANARRSEVRDNSQLISEMIADAKQLFGPSNRYSQLTTPVAISSRIIPANLHVPNGTEPSTAAINSYGGSLEMKNITDTNNDQARMVFGKVPQNQCVDLALSIERPLAALAIVPVGEGTDFEIPLATDTTAASPIVKANADGSALSIAEVKTACDANPTSDLVLYFGRN